MIRDGTEGDKYIAAFPQFKKWIVECACCHRKGYRPDMPEHIGHAEFNLGASTIKKYFSELALDEDNICPECRKMLNAIKNDNK